MGDSIRFRPFWPNLYQALSFNCMREVFHSSFQWKVS